MTTHAIIRNGVRTLVASLLAAVLLALLALPAQAGKNSRGGSHIQIQEIQVQKYLDRSTTRTTGTSKGKGQQYMNYKMNNTYISN